MYQFTITGKSGCNNFQVLLINLGIAFTFTQSVQVVNLFIFKFIATSMPCVAIEDSGLSLFVRQANTIFIK